MDWIHTIALAGALHGKHILHPARAGQGVAARNNQASILADTANRLAGQRFHLIGSTERQGVNVNITDQRHATVHQLLHLPDIDRIWFVGMQAIHSQSQQILQEGQEAAIGVEDPRQAYIFSHPLEVRHKKLTKKARRNHRPAAKGNIITGPDEIKAQGADVADSAGKPVVV